MTTQKNIMETLQVHEDLPPNRYDHHTSSTSRLFLIFHESNATFFSTMAHCAQE